MSYSRSVVGSKSCEKLIGSTLHIFLEEGPNGRADVGTGEGEGDLGFEEPDLVAAVEATPLIAQSVEGLLADQLRHRIGQLHLVARAALHQRQVIQNFRH